MIFLFGLITTLFIPFLIVAFWRKRPVWAFIVASIVLIITLVAPGIIKIFQAVTIYGAADPQLVAGGISEAIVSGFMASIVPLPILLLFQWFIHRFFNARQTSADIGDTFS